MQIAGLVKCSTVDYPGMLSCVVFVPGCNFNCFFCHNRRLIEGKVQLIAEHEVISFLKKRQGLLDGVVITGGEPTLQASLEAFICKVKALGFKVKLDTNGSNPDVLRKLIKKNLLDYVAVDYKAPSERYMEICDAKADGVKHSLLILKNSDVPYQIRTTMIPTLTKQDYLTMAKEIATPPVYVLNKYRIPEYYLPGDKERIFSDAPDEEETKKITTELKKLIPDVLY